MPLTFTKDGELTSTVQNHVSRETCRACSSPRLELVLDLGSQYLPAFVQEIDLALPQAPLQLMRCDACDLLQLGHTVNADMLFRKYWYRSGINRTMREQLADLVEAALDYHRGGDWLDIGANDGYLLSLVPEDFYRVACEPALDFHDALTEFADRVIPDYFSAHDRQYDVITSAACFYDVDEPHPFLSDIVKSLKHDGVWVNQLNDAPTMLKKNAFDSVCHEHLCYYDVPTLDRMYRQHGLTITRLEHNDVNGGSVRIFARKNGQKEDLLGLPKVTPDTARAFAHRAWKWKDRMLDLCRGPLSQSPTYLYGASTKAMVMLQYLGSNETFVAAAERNALKYGLKMAGTWTPIVSEDEMRAARPRYVVVGPWGLAREEFIQRERMLLENDTVLVFPLPNIEIVL